MSRPRLHLEGDWYPRGLPSNVDIGEGVYIDTSYAFDACESRRDHAISLGAVAGVYDRTSFVVGRGGEVIVGAFTCLNGVTIVANERVEIGAHCLLAWGAVVTDSPTGVGVPAARRRAVLTDASACDVRELRPLASPAPVVLERNVWLGFNSVVGPGVRIGEGSVIGCRSVVLDDVPPYSVAVGNPTRVTGIIEPGDSVGAMSEAANDHSWLAAPGVRPYLTGVINDRVQRRPSS